MTNWADLRRRWSADADAVIHFAGVNRGDRRGGRARATSSWPATLADGESLRLAGRVRVVYANSIQAGNGTPYGDRQGRRRDILGMRRPQEVSVVDVLLPNLFGEHGRPHTTRFVATFGHERRAGRAAPRSHDREVELLHAQDAARR